MKSRPHTTQRRPLASKRYVDAFLDDATECLLHWRETCVGLEAVPLHMQPRIGWESLHSAVAHLLDGARRVDFTDLAQFLQTMLEPIAMIRDGLLPPNRLVLETLSQTQAVVEGWIHNLANDQQYLPAAELVKFAAETAVQIMLPPANTSSDSNAPSITTESVTEKHLQTEIIELKNVTEKQFQSLEQLNNAVTRLEQVTESSNKQPRNWQQFPGKAASLSSVDEFKTGIDRETLAQMRGRIIKRALPTAYVVLKLGKTLLAARAADIAPITRPDIDGQPMRVTLAEFAHAEVPTSLSVDGVEGFLNISDEHIDQNITIQGAIPRKWHRGIMSWKGETVCLVDLKGYLKDVAQLSERSEHSDSEGMSA